MKNIQKIKHCSVVDILLNRISSRFPALTEDTNLIFLGYSIKSQIVIQSCQLKYKALSGTRFFPCSAKKKSKNIELLLGFPIHAQSTSKLLLPGGKFPLKLVPGQT